MSPPIHAIQPCRDMSPLGHGQYRTGLGIPDNGDILRGRYVEPGRQVQWFGVLKVEGFPDPGFRGV